MENDSFSPLTAGVLLGEIDNDLRLIRQGSREKQSEDVILHDFLLLGHRAALLYIDGLSDDEKLQRFVLAPCLNAPPVPAGREPGEYLSRSVLQVASVQRTSRLSEVLCCVCGGDAALISESLNVCTKIGPRLCLLMRIAGPTSLNHPYGVSHDPGMGGVRLAAAVSGRRNRGCHRSAAARKLTAAFLLHFADKCFCPLKLCRNNVNIH